MGTYRTAPSNIHGEFYWYSEEVINRFDSVRGKDSFMKKLSLGVRNSFYFIDFNMFRHNEIHFALIHKSSIIKSKCGIAEG